MLQTLTSVPNSVQRTAESHHQRAFMSHAHCWCLSTYRVQLAWTWLSETIANDILLLLPAMYIKQRQKVHLNLQHCSCMQQYMRSIAEADPQRARLRTAATCLTIHVTGFGWAGPDCCQPGSKCGYLNKYMWVCLAVRDPAGPETPAPTAQPTDPADMCARPFKQCGGARKCSSAVLLHFTMYVRNSELHATCVVHLLQWRRSPRIP